MATRSLLFLHKGLVALITSRLDQFDHKKIKPSKEDEIITFENLFNERYKDRIDDFILILKDVTPPLLSPDNNFLQFNK